MMTLCVANLAHCSFFYVLSLFGKALILILLFVGTIDFLYLLRGNCRTKPAHSGQLWTLMALVTELIAIFARWAVFCFMSSRHLTYLARYFTVKEAMTILITNIAKILFSSQLWLKIFLWLLSSFLRDYFWFLSIPIG